MKMCFFRSAVPVLGLALAAGLLRAAPNPTQPVPDTLDLPTALTFALENNFVIRQAKEQIRQQEGVVLEVTASRLPSVGASGSYAREKRAIDFYGDSSYWTMNITARQALYAGGGIEAGIRGQKLNLEAATLTLQSVINDALLDVRTKFYTVLVDREKIKVQEQNVELLKRQLQDVRSRYEAGTVSNFEVLRAEVSLANAQPALITSRNDYRLAIEELRQALGFVTATEPNVTKTPEFIGRLEFSSLAYELRPALASAREKRPDLLRLYKLQTAAEEGILTSRSTYYPTLALVGGYDWIKSPTTESFVNSHKGWTVGLQSSWAIFDGRATAGRVAQSRSLLEQAKLAVASAELSVDVDVRRAISSLQEANELAEASKKVTEQAEESVRLANARFDAGTATQLDVLTAQNDLTTARLNQLQAYYSFNVAVANVRRAMGLTDDMK
ncbi:MAG: TolC family protein [Opitutales bacterium]